MASIAKQRIKRLLGMAEVSNRNSLVEKALEIGEKQNVSIPERFSKNICGNCNNYLEGEQVQVRLNSDKHQLNYKCRNCGEVNRYGY